MTTLRVENIQVRLGATEAVRDLSFAVAPGELVALVGPNGAGKSSALRAAAGLLPRYGGEVWLGEDRLDALSPRARAHRLAYLPQAHAAHWGVSVERLVTLGRIPHRRGFAPLSTQDRAVIANAMAHADVSRFRERTVQTLSGGERARVMLARALAVEASLLLADEPVASLDPYHQLRVMELLRETAQAGTAVVCVLHDLTLASRFCDRVMVMAEGRLLIDDRPEAALRDEIVRAAYGVETETGRRDGVFYVLPWRRKA